MASPASTLISSIARRVRDPNNTAHTQAFVRDILDRVQVIVNDKQEYVLTDTVLTATPGQVLYSVENDLGNIVTVTRVSINGRDLDRQNWHNLHRINSKWLQAKGGTPTAWAPIGRSLIAIYPAPDYAAEITFTGTKITTALSDNNIQLEVELEDEDVIREIVTAILLIRQRDLDMVGPIISRAGGKIELQMNDDMI